MQESRLRIFQMPDPPDAKGHASRMAWALDRVGSRPCGCMKAIGPDSEALAIALSDTRWHVRVAHPGKRGHASHLEYRAVQS